MSFQALNELSKIRNLSKDGYQMLEKARKSQQEFDTRIEKQVILKHVGQALLNKSCSI